jgi:cysteine protease ATG4
MLRSAQMMIAQAFIMHFLDRDWDMFRSVSPTDHTMHREIITWFNDRPSLKCPFGLHRLLDVAERMGKKVGDWFGPVSVTQILRDALERGKEFIGFLDGVKIYVAQDCCVYKQDVLDLCLRADENDSKADEGAGRPSTLFTPVVIMVSVRLGGEELNEIYVPTLKLFLEMTNCLGIIGGKPKHSLYFIGYQDDKVIYLDPHVCQDTVDISSQDFDKSVSSEFTFEKALS